jgi:hypothetical protein
VGTTEREVRRSTSFKQLGTAVTTGAWGDSNLPQCVGLRRLAIWAPELELIDAAVLYPGRNEYVSNQQPKEGDKTKTGAGSAGGRRPDEDVTCRHSWVHG